MVNAGDKQQGVGHVELRELRVPPPELFVHVGTETQAARTGGIPHLHHKKKESPTNSGLLAALKKKHPKNKGQT